MSRFRRHQGLEKEKTARGAEEVSMKKFSFVRVSVGAALVVSASFIAACDHTVEPLTQGKSDPEASEVYSPPNVGAASGPWSRCTFDGPAGPFPSLCPDPASKGCDSSSLDRSYQLEDGSTACVVATVCTYACKAADDCPAPPSGTVVPVCNRSEECVLPCSQNSECPDGMICFNDGYVDDRIAGSCQWTYTCSDSGSDD
jgi:hypothetical protein